MGEGKAAVDKEAAVGPEGEDLGPVADKADKADKAVDQVLVLAAHKVVEGLVLAADKAAG